MGPNSKPKKQDSPKQGDGELMPEPDCDILFGMKSICQFLGRSEATITKFAQEYDDFPVRRDNGKGYVASRTELNRWFRAYVSGKE